MITNFAQKRKEREREIKSIKANFINFTLVHYSCPFIHQSTHTKKYIEKLRQNEPFFCGKRFLLAPEKADFGQILTDRQYSSLPNMQTPMLHFILFLQLELVFEKRQ